MTDLRTNGLTWVGARDTCVSKKRIVQVVLGNLCNLLCQRHLLSDSCARDSQSCASCAGDSQNVKECARDSQNVKECARGHSCARDSQNCERDFPSVKERELSCGIR